MSFRGDLEALVLAVLDSGPLHGYEISRQIKERSAEVFKIGEGQLYPCLHRLQRDGLIHAEWVLEEGKNPRKVYAMTNQGQTELVDKRKVWDEFAAGVASVLTPHKPATGDSHG